MGWGEKVGEGLFVAGRGGALLFWIGQDSFGRRGVDDGAGMSLGSLDLERVCFFEFAMGSTFWRGTGGGWYLDGLSNSLEELAAEIRPGSRSRMSPGTRWGWKSAIFSTRSQSSGRIR